MSPRSPTARSKACTRPALKGIRVEGKKNGDWVLIDAGDVIVHVFRPEVRAFYDLEKMWAGSGARRSQQARPEAARMSMRKR